MRIKRAKVAVDMLLCNTVAEVCIRNKISESTYYRLQKDPEFRQLLSETKRRLFEESMAEVQAASVIAVKTLKTVATNDNAPASARVSAAGRILDVGSIAFEIDDILERIQKLEEEDEKKTTKL